MSGARTEPSRKYPGGRTGTSAGKFNIGPIGPTSKRSTLLEEIAKCQVVCANCHAMRTHARKELKKSA